MSSRKRKINQFDLQGNFIKSWYGIQVAADALGVRRKGISACLSGKSKTSLGFKWEYDYDELPKELKEVWKDHPVYNLKGSSCGRIQHPSGRKTFGHETRSGYRTVGVPITNDHKMVHRIVWECFNGIIPNNMFINHKDKSRTNNSIINLELVTTAENNAHARNFK